MTIEEMTQQTINHWKMYYPEEYAALDGGWAMRQATACAKLTRSEMDAQKMVAPGMTDEEAWNESRNLFCLTPPPEPEEEEPEEETEAEKARRRADYMEYKLGRKPEVPKG